jgi:hypothetical protein
MRHLNRITLGLALAMAACNDGGSSDEGADTTTGTETSTGGETTTAPMTTMQPTTDPDTSGSSSTTEAPPTECERTVRYPLFEGTCSRVMTGDIDGDGFGDAVAFVRQEKGDTTTLQTFLGGNIGLASGGVVHCCVDASASGHSLVYDINGDTREDLIWSTVRNDVAGDEVQTYAAIDRIIRGPETGYTAHGTLFARPVDDTTPIPFTIGAIMPGTTGFISIDDGMLKSSLANGSAFGFDVVASIELDPTPEIWALESLEINDSNGVDVVGVGPDGLSVWGGSIEGVYSQAVVTALPGDYTHIEALDLDLDGNRQLVLFGQGQPVALADRDGKGGIALVVDGNPTVSPPATVVRVNGDLYPDLVGVDGGSLVYYPGDGEVFEPAVVMAPAGAAFDIDIADFDGNGRDDVVLCDDEGLLVVYAEDR